LATYEFRCQKCKKEFEVVFSFAEYDQKKGRTKCPKCGSRRVSRRISTFEVKTSKKT
jgi:putative FmdB family regulatory protein